MKKQILSAFLIFMFQAKAQVPVYLYFASHNETNDSTFHGLDYGNAGEFGTIKNYVQAVCDSIIVHNASYLMMVESNFIFGAIQNDNAASSSADILQWANAQSQIEVEPHNHFQPIPGPAFNPYNYADLAHLLDSCGLPGTRKLMGGFIWRDFTAPPVSEDWTQWQTPQNGFTFTNYFWQPEIIWGGGSPGHQDDFDAFGIWRPQDATSAGFGINSPSQNLVCLGGGCGEDFVLWDTTNVQLLANKVINLLDEINSSSWPADSFFTFKIMMNFRNFPSAGYVDKVGELLRILQPFNQMGYFEYKLPNEILSAWQAAHPDHSDYFLVKCDSVHITNETPTLSLPDYSESVSQNDISIFPNPVKNEISIRTNLSSSGVAYQIIDLTGRVILSGLLQGQFSNLYVGGISPGIYILKTNGTTRPVKFIKN